MAIKKQMVIKWLLATLWILVGSGTIVLLVAAIQRKDSARCKDVKVNIAGVNNNFFVDKSDILNSIKTILGGEPKGKSVKSFDLKKMETELDKNIWVKSAELFFDNNEILRVNVVEREPIARIFTTEGSTFYIDSSVKILPLSDKLSARLPIFTNFPASEYRLSKDDSSLLKDIRTISMAIQKDTFRMAMIEQIDITSQRTFEMMPKIGDQLIVFGDASDADDKFNKMQLFYKDVMTKSGWNYYSTINVQYKGQVVAKRKGTAEVVADSLETMRLMKMIAANAEKMSGDSLFQMIAKENALNADTATIALSFEREDEGYDIPTTIEKPKEAVVTKPGTTVKKPVTTKPAPATAVKKPVTASKPSAAKPVTAKPTATTKPAVKNPTPAKPTVVEKPAPKPAAKAPAKPAATTTKPAATVKPKPAPKNNDY